MNTIIHAAVRRDLDRFVAALAAFPAGSAPRATQLGAAWRNLSHQLDEHHEAEETLFWPALRELGADEALVGDLAGEHQRLLAALAAAGSAMARLETAATADNAAAADDAMRQLRDVVETHFAHEERELEPLLVSNLDSPPVKRASKQVQRSQPPAAAGRFFAWLQDGAQPEDRAALRSTIPPPVLFVFGRLLGRSYRRQVASVWAS